MYKVFITPASRNSKELRTMYGESDDFVSLEGNINDANVLLRRHVYHITIVHSHQIEPSQFHLSLEYKAGDNVNWIGVTDNEEILTYKVRTRKTLTVPGPKMLSQDEIDKATEKSQDKQAMVSYLHVYPIMNKKDVHPSINSKTLVMYRLVVKVLRKEDGKVDANHSPIVSSGYLVREDRKQSKKRARQDQQEQQDKDHNQATTTEHEQQQQNSPVPETHEQAATEPEQQQSSPASQEQPTQDLVVPKIQFPLTKPKETVQQRHYHCCCCCRRHHTEQDDAESYQPVQKRFKTETVTIIILDD